MGAKEQADRDAAEAADDDDPEKAILENYMGEFKVATFKLREKTQAEIEHEQLLLKNSENSAEYDPEYEDAALLAEKANLRLQNAKEVDNCTNVGFWNNLLSEEYEKKKQAALDAEFAKLRTMGRGKRLRNGNVCY